MAACTSSRDGQVITSRARRCRSGAVHHYAEDRPEKIRGRHRQGRSGHPADHRRDRTTIDIENDGTVKIASVSGAAGREAQGASS